MVDQKSKKKVKTNANFHKNVQPSYGTGWPPPIFFKLCRHFFFIGPNLRHAHFRFRNLFHFIHNKDHLSKNKLFSRGHTTITSVYKKRSNSPLSPPPAFHKALSSFPESVQFLEAATYIRPKHYRSDLSGGEEFKSCQQGIWKFGYGKIWQLPAKKKKWIRITLSWLPWDGEESPKQL